MSIGILSENGGIHLARGALNPEAGRFDTTGAVVSNSRNKCSEAENEQKK